MGILYSLDIFGNKVLLPQQEVKWPVVYKSLSHKERCLTVLSLCGQHSPHFLDHPEGNNWKGTALNCSPKLPRAPFILKEDF